VILARPALLLPTNSTSAVLLLVMVASPAVLETRKSKVELLTILAWSAVLLLVKNRLAPLVMVAWSAVLKLEKLITPWPVELLILVGSVVFGRCGECLGACLGVAPAGVGMGCSIMRRGKTSV